MVDEDKAIHEVEVSEGTKGDVVRRETVRSSGPANGRSVARQIIWYVVYVIVAFLLLRIVLQLLGANQGNAIVDFIYGVSGFLAAPFFGMFSYTPSYGASLFEISTLVAAIVYLLIGWALSAMFSFGEREARV